MRLLIKGGAGFVGSHAAEYYLKTDAIYRGTGNLWM